MRSILALAAGFTIAALTIPVLANSAPTRNADAVTLLQRRVTTLETKMRAVNAVLKSQAKINTLQLKIDTRHDQQISNVDNRVSALETAPAPTPTLTVSSYLGAPALIGYRAWGYPTATCLNGGTLISGGFDTNYPIEVGRSMLSSLGSSWNIAAWNPYNETAIVTPYAICAKVSS